MLMITPLTPWRLAVHFGYQISLTGGGSKNKLTQSMLVSPMWLARCFEFYQMVLEWTLVFPLRETLLAGQSLKSLARRFRKKSWLRSLLEPIMEYWHAIVQDWI